LKAIVLGGGIGGMTSALCLLRRGVRVEVYEQARQLTEIGAGLQLAASASRILVRLGLGEELARAGVTAEHIDMRDLRSDRPIYSVPLGTEAARRYGEPFYQVHRPDLLAMLANALPPEIVHLGERATGFAEDDVGVTVSFESGRRARADVVVGADGIHSMVRRQILGEQELEFARIVAWRALIPKAKAAHLDLARDCHVWLGPKRSAVVYWVHGGELLNFVGMVPSAEAAAESWTTTGELGALRASYAGCAPRLRAIVNLIGQPFITGYYFRYPLPKWSRGRATILGDAAHPMHPFLAQGACQAIEDAAALAHVLAEHDAGDVPKALSEYERRRIGRTSRVQNQARTHEHLWHMSEPREIVQRNRVLASTMEIDPWGETIWGWLFGYDVEAECARPLTDPADALRRPEARRVWRRWAGMLQPRDLDRQHLGIREAYDRFLLRNCPADPAARIEDSNLDGLGCLRVTYPDAHPGRVLLHLHGGGYVLGSPASSTGLACRLAKATRGSCIVPGYRRAPEHPFPAALDDAVAAYRALLERGVDPRLVVLSGDSSGGGLAVALAMRARDLELPTPAGIVALCPWADLTVAGATVDTAAEPLCTRAFLTNMAANYLQTYDPADPLASPVYGDYRGLPPMLVQTAQSEALYDDAVRVAEAARRDGVAVELDAYPDTVHLFQLFDQLPEAHRAANRVGVFVGAVSGTGAFPSR
jgi:salicylate hydroxylase